MQNWNSFEERSSQVNLSVLPSSVTAKEPGVEGRVSGVLDGVSVRIWVDVEVGVGVCRPGKRPPRELPFTATITITITRITNTMRKAHLRHGG